MPSDLNRNPHYTGSWSIRNDKSYHTSRRSDFGSVNIRPNSHKRPAGRDDVYTTRRSNGSNNRISTGTRNSSTRRSSVDSGRKSSKESVVLIKDEKLCGVFPSIQTAGKMIGVAPSLISAICRKVRGKHTANGYRCFFEDSNDWYNLIKQDYE